MTTISIHMPEQSGLAGQSLWLRSTVDGSLLNAGGDTLSESPAGSGRFVATVAETYSVLLAAVVMSGGLAVRDGWLAVDETVVRDAYPSAGGGGTGDAEQATLLAVQTTTNAIASSLSGRVVNVRASVAAGGTVPATIGDDFRVRSGTQLRLPVSDVDGVIAAKFIEIGLENLDFGASLPGKPAGQISGTIAAITTVDNVTTITVEICSCADGLQSGDATYQIQTTQTHADEIDNIVELQGTLQLSRRTVARRS